MKKVMLINPNSDECVYGKLSDNLSSKSFPLGLAYISAFLKNNCVEVLVVDANAKKMSYEDLKDMLRSYTPDFVGITSTTPAFGAAVKTSILCKEFAPVVLGGQHATALAKDILEEYDCFDFLVRGEGEYAMLDIVLGKDKKDIEGISYVSEGKIFHNPSSQRIKNLDDLPSPDYDSFDLEDYKDPIWNLYAKKIAPIITSRGCPYNCTFCASKIMFGRQTYYRSINAIIEEIKMLVAKQEIDGVYFVDDTLTLKKERITELCDFMKDLNLVWFCNVRVDTVDFETLKLMKDSGCVLVMIGVEAGTQEQLNILKKGTTIEQIEEAFKNIHKVGLDSFSTFILGAPNETKETMDATIKLAKKINSKFSMFFNMVPYPGTEIYDYAKQNDLFLFDNWEELSAPKYGKSCMKHLNITLGDLEKFRKKAYIKTYVRPSYIFKHMPKNKLWQHFVLFRYFLRVIK